MKCKTKRSMKPLIALTALYATPIAICLVPSPLHMLAMRERERDAELIILFLAHILAKKINKCKGNPMRI